MLDIIVPHYREPWSEGKKLFDMLALQRGVDFSDFRVILVNDGDDGTIPPETFREYPFRVDTMTIPHGGVSVARNKGLDAADAEWVMFCDFDDAFTSVYALRSIMDVLDTEDYDMLWCPFYEELSGSQNRVIKDDFNLIFVHGKVYRRSFLNRYGIRFEPELRFSEDAAFNSWVSMDIDQKRIGRLKNELVPYVWTFRPGSITTDRKNVISNGIGLYHRQLYVAQKYLEHGNRQAAHDLYVRAACDAYVMLYRKDVRMERDKWDTFLVEVKAFAQQHRQDLQTVSLYLIRLAYASSLRELGVKPELLPRELPVMNFILAVSGEESV